ncbi:MAG: hypothetical protein AAF560_23015 [Acidobacteriota bacterium]
MRSKRIQDRTDHALTTVWATFASADAASEASRRRLGIPEHDERTLVGDMLVDFGGRILNRLHDLLTLDDRYQQLRARQRQRQAQRDAVARRLYRELNQARPRLRRLMRDELIRQRLQKLGATRRRPKLLCWQTREVLLLLRCRQPEREWPIATRVIEELAAELSGSLHELEQALNDVEYGRKETQSAMVQQRKAMKRFDHTYLHSARVLEARLNLVGLPTLADAIRPHVGRAGRPRKHRPVDLHPDLVDQVLGTGLVRLDTGSAGLSPEMDTASTRELDLDSPASSEHPRGIGVEPSSQGENPGDFAVLPLQESANPGSTAGLSGGEAPNTGDLASEKVEHFFTELSEGLEKLEQTLSEPVKGLEIIEPPLPELEIDDRKVAHRLTERRRFRVSDPKSTLELPVTRIVRRRCPHRRSHVARGRALADLSRVGPATSKVGRVRRAASGWWEKWRTA